MKKILNRVAVIFSICLIFGIAAEARNAFDNNNLSELNSAKKGKWTIEITCETIINEDGSKTRKCEIVIKYETARKASLSGILNTDTRRNTASLTNVQTTDQKEPLVIDEAVVLDERASRIFGYKSVTILPNRYELKNGGTFNLKFEGKEPIVIRPSQTLKSRIDKADELFATLENLIAKIEKSKNVEEADLDTFDKTALEIGKTLKNAFDEVSASAQLASRTQGKEGNATDLEYFEDQAERHIKKANLIAKKTEEINNAVEGKIIICIPCELRDRRVRDSKSENIFSDKTSSIFVKASFSTAENSACESTSDFDSNNLFSSYGLRSKSVAVACVSFCSAQLWLPCAACVAKAAITGTSKYNEFMNGWNGCASRKKEWQRKACRALVLAKFVYWIY